MRVIYYKDMKIFVVAKTNSKQVKVEKVSDNNFIVYVRESPVEGKANAAIVKAIAKHFGLPLQVIKIIAGHKSKQKIIELVTKVN